MFNIHSEDCGVHAEDTGAMQSRSYGWLDERQEERGQVRIKPACTYFTILRLFSLSESLAFRGGFDLVTGKSASAGAAEIVQENQAVKKQRLDDGRARQVKGDEIKDETFKSIFPLRCCNSFDACVRY